MERVPVKRIMTHLYWRASDSHFFPQNEARGEENIKRGSLRRWFSFLAAYQNDIHTHTHTHTHTGAQFKPVGFWPNRSRRGYRNSYFYKMHRWFWCSTRFVNHYLRRPRTYDFGFYSYFVLMTLCASSKYSAHCTWSSYIEQTSGEASRPLSALGAACTWWVNEIPTHFLMWLGSLPIAQGKWV